MPRRVFFSFHYDDVTRANVVRNSDIVTREYEGAARFHDMSLWEASKAWSADSLKRTIDEALIGTSVTCVLIGQQTWQRPWVRYEIIRSMARGNGLFGVQIHDVGFAPAQPGIFGSPRVGPGAAYLLGQARPTGLFSNALRIPETPPRNPFSYLGYAYNVARDGVSFYEIVPEWRLFDRLPSIPLSTIPWLTSKASLGQLHGLFPVYGWKEHDGHPNFPYWVESAARNVGR